jgi:hypothetical protein
MMSLHAHFHSNNNAHIYSLNALHSLTHSSVSLTLVIHLHIIIEPLSLPSLISSSIVARSASSSPLTKRKQKRSTRSTTTTCTSCRSKWLRQNTLRSTTLKRSLRTSSRTRRSRYREIMMSSSSRMLMEMYVVMLIIIIVIFERGDKRSMRFPFILSNHPIFLIFLSNTIHN